MKRNVFAGVLAITILSTSSNAFTPVCDGTCGECNAWMPLLRRAATELKNSYLNAENRVSERYNSVIFNELEERKKLLLQYDKLLAELEALNRLIVIETKKHLHERNR